MKLVLSILVLAALLLTGGLTYLAVTDIKIEQTQISKQIPNERFF